MSLAILASRGSFVLRIDRMIVLQGPALGSHPYPGDDRQPAAALSVRAAAPGDLEMLIRVFPHNANRYEERLRRRDECLLVLDDASPIGMTWLGFDPRAPREFGCSIHLPDASCWEYDTFILAEHRKLGAFAFLMRDIFQRLRVRGVRHVYAAVGQLNKVSLTAHERLGYRTAGLIDRVVAPGIEFIRVVDGAGKARWCRGGSGRTPTLSPGVERND